MNQNRKLLKIVQAEQYAHQNKRDCIVFYCRNFDVFTILWADDINPGFIEFNDAIEVHRTNIKP